MEPRKPVNRGRKKSLKCMLAFFVLLYAETSALTCKVKIDPQDPDKGVFSNETLTLECNAYGALADSFLWKKNGMLIGNSSTPSTSFKLSITVVKDIHDEEYNCTVNKGEYTAQCSSKLNVNIYGKPVIDESNPHPFEYEIDDNADKTIYCKVKSGRPLPKLEWRVNGTKVGELNGPFTLRDGQPNAGLGLRRSPGAVTKKEVYLAECTARNKHGTTTARTTISILPSKHIPIVPKVTTKSRRVLAYAGQNVTLTCEEWNACKERVDFNPTINWYFHNKTTSIAYQDENESLKQCKELGKLLLRLPIVNVTVKDQGTYICEVELKVNNISDETIGLVLVHKGFLNVTSELLHIEVQARKDVTMECVTTYPDVATLGEFWTLNGALLQSNDIRYTKRKDIVIQDRNSTQNKIDKAKFQGTKVKFSLTIHNVTQRDLGLYECGVNTTLGIEKASIQLLRAKPTKKAAGKPNQTSIGVIAGGAAMGLVMIAIAVGACWHFHKAKGMKKWDVSMSAGSYKYDVFVTFSGKDVQWVEQELVPVLEKNCITFCIHNRDFELGKPFVDNMIESVYSSRKILAIVSKNYMASNFCRGELELALQRSVEEKADTSLVLLRLDDILKSKLPKLLRGKTFLDYHDTEGRGDWESRLVKTLSKEEAKLSV